MNKMKSFVKQFIAVVKGDDAEASAQKALRQADSALRSQIAALEGDTIQLEDAVTEALEAETIALVNSGQPITKRELYVESLYNAANRVTKAEDLLSEHRSKIDFLKKKLEQLSEEVEG